MKNVFEVKNNFVVKTTIDRQRQRKEKYKKVTIISQIGN